MIDREGDWNTAHLRIGDCVRVRAYKSDDTCYRGWTATVETVDTDQLALVTPAGHLIQDPGGDFRSKHALRVFYWPGRWYSLLEAYDPSGELAEIYVNISSPVEIEGLQMRFTDLELDVSRIPPGEARLEDEDEFQEAAVEFGYSEELQRTCYEVAREALDLANSWKGPGMPADR